MAISPFKTFAAGEILTASDLNSSFSQITTNGESLAWPATVDKDLNGNGLILDSDADSKLYASADDVVTLDLQNTAVFIFDGDVASVADGITFTAAATGTAPAVGATGTTTNISLRLQPKGTGDVQIAAGGSETDVLVTADGSETNVALRIRGKGTGTVQLGDADLAFPDADGNAGEYLTTDGAGTLSFASPFAAADRLFFQQTTPSGNYTKDTGITDDTAIRLTTGTAGSVTGQQTFTTAMGNRATSTQSANHDHTFNDTSSGPSGTNQPDGNAGVATSGAATHTHSVGGTTGANSANHTHTYDMRINYYDVVIGEVT